MELWSWAIEPNWLDRFKEVDQRITSAQWEAGDLVLEIAPALAVGEKYPKDEPSLKERLQIASEKLHEHGMDYAPAFLRTVREIAMRFPDEQLRSRFSSWTVARTLRGQEDAEKLAESIKTEAEAKDFRKMRKIKEKLHPQAAPVSEDEFRKYQEANKADDTITMEDFLTTPESEQLQERMRQRAEMDELESKRARGFRRRDITGRMAGICAESERLIKQSVHGVDYTDQEIQMIASEIERAIASLKLMKLALGKPTNTDWDAELEKLDSSDEEVA